MSFLDNLDIKLKLIALSETWIKPYHIDYNMTHYSFEQDYRQKRRWCMSIYIHESLQYQLRKDLRIGKDSESIINSLFIEINKLTIGTKYKVIIGCIYRPPGSIFAICMIY